MTVKEIVAEIARSAGVPLCKFPVPQFFLKVAAWKLETFFSMLGKEAPLTRGKLAFFVHPKPLSIQKASSELGYEPEWDFKTGVANTITWYRNNGWLP